MPWIDFMNGMSHYYLGGGVVQIYHRAYLGDMIWSIYHLFCAIKCMQGLHNIALGRVMSQEKVVRDLDCPIKVSKGSSF